MTTTNLSDFGYRELDMAADTLKAFCNGHNCPYFGDSGVQLMMNQSSGNVFLTDEDFNVLMLTDDGTLEGFYNSPYEGKEGFFSDLMDEYKDSPEDWHEEDVEWLKSLAEAMGEEFPETEAAN